MDIRLDQDWRLRPIKGDTGKAYIGLKDNDKSLYQTKYDPDACGTLQRGDYS